MDPRGVLLRKWTVDTPLLAEACIPTQEEALRLALRTIGHRRVRPCQQARDWPSKTDVWCWHCCHPFDTPPLPMPIKYDDRRNVFHVTGTFCSWACMKKHNGESVSYLKHVNATLITLFHKRCTGKMADRIVPAPPRVALRVFGGTMTIDEFRAASDKGVLIATMPPKMIVHHATLEESTSRPKARVHDMDETICFKDATTKNETLRLKRPKPLQKDRNTLERIMGINALLGVQSS